MTNENNRITEKQIKDEEFTRYRLFIPGPVEVTPEVMASMSKPIVMHYGKEWANFYHETTKLLGKIFSTKGSVHIIPGSGSAGLDMALGTIAGLGGVLVLKNGFFGDRMEKILRTYTNNLYICETPLGQAIDETKLDNILHKHSSKIRSVVVVHCETSTGALNPIRKLGKVCKQYNTLLVVDTISSLGIEPLCMDEWGIDICISASQKGLESPPGVAVLAIGQECKKLIKNINRPGWYLNLSVWENIDTSWASWHPSPVTMPTSVIRSLRVAIDNILSEGLKKRFSRHKKITNQLRNGLKDIGFNLFVKPEVASHGITAVECSPKKKEKILSSLEKEHRIILAGGLGGLRNKIFRIGHIGPYAQEKIIDELLGYIAEACKCKQ